MAVVIDDSLATFLESPVMIVVGTRDNMLRPALGRAVGAKLSPNRVMLDLWISEWQWPETVANLRDIQSAAVTFSRPTDYVSYQLKGAVEEIGVVEPAGWERVNAYTALTTAVLMECGVPRSFVDHWFTTANLVKARIRIADVFAQTPGPSAGRSVTGVVS